jgi:hypothetical protein
MLKREWGVRNLKSIYVICMKYLGFNRRQKHTEKSKKGEAENVYLTSPEMTVRHAGAEIWTRGIEV